MIDQPNKLNSIIKHALDLRSPLDRARYLAGICGDDEGLRGDVDSLLWAHEVAAAVPRDTAPFPTMSVDDLTDFEGPGSILGPYRLLRVIGQGGMGVVYEAEQTHPIPRKVALKIIRPEMDSRMVIARFEAERQTLAMMDHPNIAKILDAGSTATGRPYFVMELVDGHPITEYCNRALLNPRDRMELMVSVCRAIQHAHQKGILHRDIKPSNVLVSLYDGRPVPKVIDFGVAKAVGQELIGRTLLTQCGMIVGTLEYMSPEQAENGPMDIDTRSDVYSLGVLIYELLTGTTPLGRVRLKHAGFSEILRRIREEEPLSPSSRIATAQPSDHVADRFRAEPAKIARLVRGELDWIAMKALEKDRSRRYTTANDLARDLRRHLDDEAIEAGPPARVYRLKKFAQRHRAAVAFGVSFAVLLAAATVISVGQADRASRETIRARAAEVEARAMLGFFRDTLLAAARPQNQEGGLGREVTLRAALDAAEPRIAVEFAGRPVVEADVRDSLGTTYRLLGELARAVHQYEKALSLRETALGPHHRDTLTSMNNLAGAYRASGQVTKAIPLQERNLAASRLLLGSEHIDTIASMSNLASAYRLAGWNEKAIPLFEGVVALRESKWGATHPDTMKSLNQLAAAYQAIGWADKAVPLHQRVLAHYSARFGRDHPDTLTAMNNLAAAYQASKRLDEALPLLEETLALRKDRIGPTHPDTLTAMNNLAATYQLAGLREKAIPLFQDVIELRKATLTPNHPDTIKSMSNLAHTFRAVGRTPEAIQIFEEVVTLRRANLRPDHPDTIKSIGQLANVYLDAGRYAEAERLFRESIKLSEVDSPFDWRRFHTMSQLGAALAGQGLYTEAEPMLINGYEGLMAFQSKIPSQHRDLVSTACARIPAFYDAWGKAEVAAAWRAKLAAAPERTDPKQ